MLDAVNDFRKKATFFEFEDNTCVAYQCEYVANLYLMLFRGSCKRDVAVQITSANCHLKVASVTSIVRSKVPGALRNSDGIRVN